MSLQEAKWVSTSSRARQHWPPCPTQLQAPGAGDLGETHSHGVGEGAEQWELSQDPRHPGIVIRFKP